MVNNNGNTISIEVNPEIRDYAENIFFGLSLRQFIWSVIGCLISVLIFFLLRGFIGMEAVSWACIIGMLPCALIGFVTYNCMPAEKALFAVIKSEILTPKKLTFKTENEYEKLLKEAELQEIKMKKNKKEDSDGDI